MNDKLSRIAWSCLTFVAFAAACGTATQPGPTPPSVGVPPATDASSAVASEPACPEELVHRPGEGCMYDAEGSPPKGKGASMRPVPTGTLGEGDEARFVHSFWVDARPVSVEDYEACLRARKCPPPGIEEGCALAEEGTGEAPVNCVSWEAARAYCAFAGKRLVTDAEWDRAVARRDDYGVQLGENSEWIRDFYCDEEIGGCGHARVLRNVNGEPEGRHRSLAHAAYSWIGFRCAWSTRQPPALDQPVAQVPIAPTTPGAITCGTTMCSTATEACCDFQLDGVGQCISKRDNDCPGLALRARCDEQADCGSGEVCCPYWSCSGGCPPEQICQRAPCDFGPEVCLPGGACRPGFACVTEADGRHAHCEWQDVGARCGGKRCSGDKPVCCWDPKSGKGRCSASACGLADERFACTGPRDCGGSVCGRAQYYGDPNQPDPGYGCVGMSHLITAFLCDKKSDCPVHPPTGANPKGCRHTSELPPGVKGCDYGLD